MHAFIHTYTHIRTCMHACMHAYTYSHVSIYIYTHTCMHICTCMYNIYMYTCRYIKRICSYPKEAHHLARTVGASRAACCRCCGPRPGCAVGRRVHVPKWYIFRHQSTYMGTARRPMYILLKGSRDLVTKVIIRVTILITAYNPSYGTYNLSYQVP